jgi:hypothetical protein
MRVGTLGTLTIGQAPRQDVVPIIDRHVPVRARRIHRGVLDGLSRAEIAARYLAEPGEAALVTRLKDGRVVELWCSRLRDGAEPAGDQLSHDRRVSTPVRPLSLGGQEPLLMPRRGPCLLDDTG